MRIRSALAATVLAAALTATGAATAVAFDDPRNAVDEPIPCSPYEGAIQGETDALAWAGAVCHRGVFDD